MIQLVVLGGGRGARLRPLTNTKHKLELSFLGQPLFWHSIYPLLDQISSIVFLLDQDSHSLEHQIDEYLGDGAIIRREAEPLGSGTALRQAYDLLDEIFLCIAGDLIYELGGPLDLTLPPEVDGRVWVYERTNAQAFGITELDQNRIIRFREKPLIDPSESYHVNTGILLIRRSTLLQLTDALVFQSFEQTVLPRLAEQGRLEAAYGIRNWFDVGTREGFLDAQRHQLTGLALQANNSLVAPSSVVRDSILRDSVIDGATVVDSVIENSLITDGVQIQGMTIIDSIIGQNAILEPGTTVRSKIRAHSDER